VRAEQGVHRRRRQWRGAAGMAARDGMGERREQGGLIYMRARVTAGDDGEVSAVLRRLDRRVYGRRCGRTGGPPRARRAYGGVVSQLEASWAEARVGVRGPRAAHDLGQRSRREGVRARPSRVCRRRPATRRVRAQDVTARWCPA
jgi:hypothetical protein